MIKLPNITADIVLETETIANYIDGLYEDVIYAEAPKVYVPNTCFVQYEQDDMAVESGAVNRYDRVYNVISFTRTNVAGLRVISGLQQLFTDKHSLQIEGSSRYMRIGSFLASRPFLTEQDQIYASIGKLHVQVRQMARRQVYPPIGGVIIRPGKPDKDADGGIIIRPGDGDDIVIGKDCRKGEM